MFLSLSEYADVTLRLRSTEAQLREPINERVYALYFLSFILMTQEEKKVDESLLEMSKKVLKGGENCTRLGAHASRRHER